MSEQRTPLLYLFDIFCCYILIHECQTQYVKSGSILRHDILEKYYFSSQAREWFAYVESFLVSTTQQTFVLSDKVLKPNITKSCFVEKMRYQDIRSKTFVLMSTITYHRITLQKELDQLKSNNTQKVEDRFFFRKPSSFFVEHTVCDFLYRFITFQLHSKLRPNITINNMFVQDTLQCRQQFGAVSLKSPIFILTYFVVFCGLYSKSNVYLDQSSFQIAIHPFGKLVIAHFEFSVMDSHKVHTVTENVQDHMQLDFGVSFPQHSLSILSYHILVRKYEIISLNVSEGHNDSVQIYDGPDSLFPRLLAEQESVSSTTSFQCTVHIVFKIRRIIPKFPSLVAFTVKENAMDKSSVVVVDFETVTLHINPYKALGFSIGLLQIKSNKNLKISFHQINFNDNHTPSCKYGGFSVYEMVNNIVHELHTVCGAFYFLDKSYHHRPVGLAGFLTRLVNYAFAPKGHLSLTVSLSPSHCQWLNVDPCFFDMGQWGRSLVDISPEGHIVLPEPADNDCFIVQLHLSKIKIQRDTCRLFIKSQEYLRPDRKLVFLVDGYFGRGESTRTKQTKHSVISCLNL